MVSLGRQARGKGSDPVTLGAGGPLTCFWIQTWDWKVLRAHTAASTHRVTLRDWCPVCLENRCPRLGPASLARGLQTTLSCCRGTQLLAGESYLTVTPPIPLTQGRPPRCVPITIWPSLG